MEIWVDDDACPVAIREILCKAAVRTGVMLNFVANRPVRVPALDNIQSVLVASGADVADNEIVARMNDGDLVVTADIPLAARVVEKGGLALNPRGELYSKEDIQSRLSMRDFMDSLRESGVDTGGPSTFSKRDRQLFANQLDKILSLKIKKASS